MQMTVGTDPEVFFTENKSVYPAGLVFEEQFGNDTVDFPYGSLIADGVALEFQPLAAPEPEVVVANLKALLAVGVNMAKTAHKKLRIIPEFPFDTAWCEVDPHLGEFGCSPDQSAWGEECRPASINAAEHPWRYAGCHIHLGVVDNQEYFMQEGVIERSSKALDRTVGLAAMVLSGNKDKLRRGVYGRPGIYRHQPWGMEYRTPSNMLLRSPTTMEFIFKLTKKVIELSVEHYNTMMAVIPDELVVQTLRGDNLKLANELYLRMANVFCLNKLPMTLMGWKTAWGFEQPEHKMEAKLLTEEEYQGEPISATVYVRAERYTPRTQVHVSEDTIPDETANLTPRGTWSTTEISI